MPRVKGGPTHARKRKRIMKKASGMRGGFGTLYRSAREFTRKADVYAYEHRKQKKRLYRSLWITRLSAALKQRGFDGFASLEPHLSVAGRSGGQTAPELFRTAIHALKAILEELP